MYRFFPLAPLILVTACAGARTADKESGILQDFQPDTRPVGKTLVYECTDGEFISRVGPGEMALWLEDRYVVLPQVRSASGTKYVEGDITYWSKGEEVLLEVAGRRYQDCTLNPARAPWEDARRRGVDFRAVGNEPGWYLEIRSDERMLFVGDYGSTRVLLDKPSLVIEQGGRVYAASEGDDQISVTISDSFCTDSMKGDQFPFTVQLNHNGRLYQGCGRDLDYPWE